MAPPQTVVTTSICSLLLVYRPQKDERLSWPSWITYSQRFTHISGHPSAVGQLQDSERLPVKDQRSTAEPRNQMTNNNNNNNNNNKDIYNAQIRRGSKCAVSGQY